MEFFRENITWKPVKIPWFVKGNFYLLLYKQLQEIQNKILDSTVMAFTFTIYGQDNPVRAV